MTTGSIGLHKVGTHMINRGGQTSKEVTADVIARNLFDTGLCEHHFDISPSTYLPSPESWAGHANPGHDRGTFAIRIRARFLIS